MTSPPSAATLRRRVRRTFTGALFVLGTLAGTLVVAAPATAAGTTQTLYSWGTFGEHGKKDPPVTTPTVITGVPGTITQLVASNAATYALTSAGTVWAFGANAFGELGDGNTTNSFSTPVQVQFPAGTVITSLPSPMPYATAFAIDKTGAIWGWGIDRGGELCLGNTDVQLLPVKLPFTNVTHATGAGLHASYVAGGKLYSCGADDDGQLGTGNDNASLVPAAVPAFGPASATITQLYSSFANTGALLSDGSFWEWGHNQVGQLGDGNLNNSDVPVQVPLGAPVTEGFIGGNDAGDGQTLVVLGGTKAGTIEGWGADAEGQLCNGSPALFVDTPITVTPPHNVTWTFVTSGGSTSYAVDAHQNLWSCGFNRNGETGRGSSSSPVLQPTSSLSHVSIITATSRNEAALTG